MSLLLISVVVVPGLRQAESGDGGDEIYYPGPSGEWESRAAEDVGMVADALKAAVDFAQANEYRGPRDLRQAILNSFEADNTIVGPTSERGGPAGMVIKDGYIVAEWGDTRRVDMTFSVSKGYLSTIAGLALNDGLIQDVHDKAGEYVRDGTFGSEHNAKITWHHLLNQSSDWSGTLFDRPDWADRPPRGLSREQLAARELREPGTSFKYNDVRVNVLSFALLQIWRRPLPEVLKERIMDPIGASPSWRWHGYENSWVEIDGVRMQSVSGGGHRGGGMFVNTRDQSRFGYLFLRNGKWEDKQLISRKWIEMLQVPSEAKANYGYLWWLNNGPRSVPSWPKKIFMGTGFGGNNIVVDQEHDLLMVMRWLEPSKMVKFVSLVLDSLDDNGVDEGPGGAVLGNAEEEAAAAKKFDKFVGVFEFEFEGEKMAFEFTVRMQKLWVEMIPREYELGELTPDGEQPGLFRKTTVHGEHWAFVFTEGAEGEPPGCRFIDEDLGLELAGVRR